MEIRPNTFYAWQMSLLTVIATTFSSNHTFKSQAHVAIWLMFRRENKSTLQHPPIPAPVMYSSVKSHKVITEKMGQI